MRIAIISYHTCPLSTLGGKNTGGMNVYIYELARKLGQMGHQLDVYTRSQDEHVPHVVHDLGFGNRVVHVPAGPEVFLPKSELTEYFDEFVEYILEFTQRKGIEYDIIHSHYWMSGIVAEKLKAAWHIPVVHMFHTLGLMKNRIAGNGEFEGDYRILGERQVLRSADKIIAATPAELSQLQWLYETSTENVQIVPPGVNIRNFYPIARDEAREFIDVPCENRMILFVGRIEPLKGIETLIQAIGLMRENKKLDNYQLCLAIIGGDADASEEEMSHEMVRLQKLRKDLGLNDFVNFLGKRPQSDLPYYYSAADIVVVPSHYESFGMVALEAMACGTPVIASQVGGLAYLIQDGVTGYHVPDNDPKALSDSLSLLLDDDKLNYKLGMQAAEYARAYSWENIAAQLVTIYQKVIQDYKSEVN